MPVYILFLSYKNAVWKLLQNVHFVFLQYSALFDDYVIKNQISCVLLHSTIKICSVYDYHWLLWITRLYKLHLMTCDKLFILNT